MIPNMIHGTSCAFGREKTARECMARAAWETEQAADLRAEAADETRDETDRACRRIMAEAHECTAATYEALSREVLSRVRGVLSEGSDRG
jgi:hypothetical protein